MSHAAIVVFTSRALPQLLADGGSGDWRLDPKRAAQAAFLICTQNRHNDALAAPLAPHGAVFLIGRVAAVVPSPHAQGRWLIKFSEYVIPPEPLPNIWGKFGHQRYPVSYTTLEDLGIDLTTLPPFEPVHPHGLAPGMAEASTAPPSPAPPSPAPLFVSRSRRHVTPAAAQNSGARLDAILAQFDRIPDLAEPANPLGWDETGLPR